MTHQNLSGPIKTRQNMSERVKTRQNASGSNFAQFWPNLWQFLCILTLFEPLLATICLHFGHISHYLLMSRLIFIIFKLNDINSETELRLDMFFFTSECVMMPKNALGNIKNVSGLNFALFWPNFDSSYASRLSFSQFVSNLAVYSLIFRNIYFSFTPFLQIPGRFTLTMTCFD